MQYKRLFKYDPQCWMPSVEGHVICGHTDFVTSFLYFDTTVTYALVNPKTKRFTSQTAKKTEYRKATHYDNDSYILEKAYYCFEHNLPSYKENLQECKCRLPGDN